MVIDDLDIVSMSGSPTEADAPLPIDANTVLPFSVTLQLLQPIRWRDLQVAQRGCRIEHSKLPERELLHIKTNSPDRFTIE